MGAKRSAIKARRGGAALTSGRGAYRVGQLAFGRHRFGTGFLLVLCQWMMIQHQLRQMFIDHMGIDFRGGHVGMAQHGLDGPQIRAARKKMGGKGMPQRMWCNFGRRYAAMDRERFVAVVEPVARQVPTSPA